MCLFFFIASDYFKQNLAIIEFKPGESWTILSPIEQSIKAKIEAKGTPLKDWDIQINYGIKTGYNEAFIISTDKKDEILSKCRSQEEREKTIEIIRPILRGRDIKRYGYEWADLWLIWIPWHFPLHLDNSIQGASEKAEIAFVNRYPALYNHLLEYKTKLSARNKAETGIRYEWYALQRWGANYWEEFFLPKLAWASVGATFYSIIDSDKFLLDTNYFFSIENPEYLLAILNSKLIITWMNTEDTPIGGGGAFRHYKYNLERLPIPILSVTQQKTFIELVTQILEKQKQKENTLFLEKQIDKKVYELYNLTDEEIAYIEMH